MLKTGDIVCTTSDSWLAKIIRRVTGGEATHVGIIVEFGRKVFIVEMLKNGVTFSSLNKYLKGNRSKIVEVNRPVGITRGHRTNIHRLVARSLHEEVKYDTKGVLAFVFKRVKENPNRFFCSEYVSMILEGAHVADIKRTSADLAPSDFQKNSKHIELESVSWT